MVLTAEGATNLHFVVAPTDARAFFRDVPEIEDLCEDDYFENARFAFPNLHFVRERTRFGQFNERYDTIRPRVTLHLAVLNDHARAILGGAENPARRAGIFGAHGVNASGENANTKSDRNAMQQRKVDVDGREIICDWHTKLRPHIDRIYFNATSHERVVVGVFRDHLD